MAKKKFESLSPEEVEGLVGKEKEAYLKWLADKNAAAETNQPSAPESIEEAAKQFFDGSPGYHLNSVFVTDDLVVYHGDVKGENTVINYAKEKGVKYHRVEKQ